MAGVVHASIDDRQAAFLSFAHRPRSDRPDSIRFREFDLRPAERLLLRNGVPVEIGCRAFDLLLVLLEHRGAIVPKNVIFEHVWPSITVEESNLRFQMASLRRALGGSRDLIKTIQGRGYLLAADARSEGARQIAEPKHEEFGRADNLLQCFSPVKLPDGDVGATVAVVDDDDATCEALEGFLRCSGLSAVCFSSVQAFLDRAPELAVHCIVLDVCMPGKTGLEFQAELAQSGLELPIIFISGHADIHMSVRAMKAGATEFLTKPVRHEELLLAIREALEHASSRAARH